MDILISVSGLTRKWFLCSYDCNRSVIQDVCFYTHTLHSGKQKLWFLLTWACLFYGEFGISFPTRIPKKPFGNHFPLYHGNHILLSTVLLRFGATPNTKDEGIGSFSCYSELRVSMDGPITVRHIWSNHGPFGSNTLEGLDSKRLYWWHGIGFLN